jgi:4-amino-4-deoxy-L-arabinose transferase-like glycosyltransferase
MENMFRKAGKTGRILLVIIIIAAGWKAILLSLNSFPFNSDEAIVALMARHILAGERPVFFYGQAYMGSLDAYLVAAGFAIFGQSVWVIRLVQSVLYLFTIITTFAVGILVFQSELVGLIATVLIAIPTVNVTLYTTVSLGGYGEAILLGNLIILTGFGILRNSEQLYHKRVYKDPFVWFALLWGVFSGIGFWANGLTLVYTVPVGVFILWRFIKKIGVISPRRVVVAVIFLLAGFLVGIAPIISHIANNDFQQLFGELFGSAVSVEQGTILQKAINHLINFILLGVPVIFGFRPPWQVTWLVLPLIPLVFFFWIWGVWSLVRNFKDNCSNSFGQYLLVAIPAVLVIAFILTSFGTDPSGRYFLPLAIPLALIAALALQKIIRRSKWSYVLLGMVVLYQAAGTIQCIAKNPPGLTTQFDPIAIVDHHYDQELIDFLYAHNEKYGYANYWISYPLAFLSGEQLIYIPRLPYHEDFRYTSRDDRYPPYTELVAQADKVAYITSNHPDLDEYLRTSFADENITWNEVQIGDYHVFYDLSAAIRPEDIGLGITN